jgi:hypothetical protein
MKVARQALPRQSEIPNCLRPPIPDPPHAAADAKTVVPGDDWLTDKSGWEERCLANQARTSPILPHRESL